MSGKAIIIIVSGIIIIAGIILYRIEAASTNIVANLNRYYYRQTEQNIAQSGVNMGLRQLANDPTWRTGFPLMNLMSGKVIVRAFDTTFQTKNVVAVSGTGIMSYNTPQETRVTSTAYLKMPTFPNVKAALNLRLSSVNEVEVESPSTINGYDHDINGNLLASGPNDKAGLAYYAGTKPELEGAINGNPKSILDTSMWNPVNGINDIIAAASYSYTGPITVGGISSSSLATFGSAVAPVIVYGDGRAGAVRFRNLTGYGVLVVRGRIDLQPNFTWHGLVIAYETGIEEWEVENNATIIGALLISGTKSDFEIELEAGCKILYSKATLNLAKSVWDFSSNGSASGVLAWWE